MATQHPYQTRVQPAAAVGQPFADGVTAYVADLAGTVLVAVTCHLAPQSADSWSVPLTIVTVDGDVDQDTAPLLEKALVQALDTGTPVRCDLSRVTFFGAAGANALAAAQQHATAVGRSLSCRGVCGLTGRVLRATGLQNLVPAATRDGDRITSSRT